jgi:DNA polymerase elongation subunit (family B)
MESKDKFIIGYIIDTYSFLESKLTLVVRTLNNNKSIIYINNFKPCLLIKYNNTNIIKLAECVYLNKLSNIEISNEIYNINPCEKEDMLKVYCTTKKTLLLLYEFFIKNNIIVYNCDKNVEYQFFNYNNIDPAILIKIKFNKFIKNNNTFIYDVNVNDISNISSEEHEKLFKKIPLQVLVFDIEVESSTNSFPNAENINDKVIAISCISFTTINPNIQDTSIYYIHTKTIIDKETMNTYQINNQYKFIDERSMLINFSRKLVECDILVDFNGSLFDIPYIIKRLSIYNTRITSLYPITIISSNNFLSFYGVIHLDVLKIFKNRDADKNKENNLNFLCMKYLRQEIIKVHDKNIIECLKFDIHNGMTCDITKELSEDIVREHFNGVIISTEIKDNKMLIKFDKEIPNHIEESCYISLVKDEFNITKIDSNDITNFKKMLLYCINDTRLTNSLLMKQNYILLYIQKSLIRSSMFRDSITRGNSYLNQYMITREMIKNKWAVKLKQLNNDKTYIDEKYTGATVITPLSGIYTNVSVLDFNSLYPSIIITYNICTTTFITHDLKIKYNIPDEQLHNMIVENEPIYFYKAEYKKGITPYFCEMFIQMRSNIKSKLNDNSLSEHEKMLLNLKQINLKVSNNSIYGSMGDANSVHFNKYVAASIPYMGRVHLEKLKIYFEKNKHVIIGGDTDSIFVKINCNQDLFDKQLIEYNNILQKPMKIEQEKVYTKLFLSNKKKKRFGLINNKIEIKGYMSIKRDTPRLLKEIETKILNIIIYNDKFENILYDYLSSINLRDIPFNMFAITKTLKGQIDYISDKVPHLALANRLISINIINSINAGDKIIYVYIENDKSKYVKDKIATLQLIEKENYKIDYLKYKNDIYNMIKLIIEDIVSKNYLEKLYHCFN